MPAIRDLANNVTSIALLPAQSHGSAKTAIAGVAVDTAGEARKLYALLTVGLGSDYGAQTLGKATVTVEIQESASSTSGWVTLGSFSPKSQTSLVAMDLTPNYRWLRASANVTVGASTVQTIDFALLGVFYDERNRPSNVTPTA
jgi:hypothetical protein